MGKEIAAAVPEAMEVFRVGSEALGPRPRSGSASRRRSRSSSTPRCSSRRSSRRASPSSRRCARAGSSRTSSSAIRSASSPRSPRCRPCPPTRRSASCASAGSRWRRRRAEHPGSMAAILGLEDEVVENLCRKILGVWPANYNCPGQIVVSGEDGAVEELLRRGREPRRPTSDQAEGLGRVPQPARRAGRRPAAAGDRPDRLPRADRAVHVDGDGEDRAVPALRRAARRPATAPVRFTQSATELIRRRRAAPSSRSGPATCSPASSSGSTRA